MAAVGEVKQQAGLEGGPGPLLVEGHERAEVKNVGWVGLERAVLRQEHTFLNVTEKSVNA
jgi:hypothetical protein